MERQAISSEGDIRHNLGLYRLRGFSGRRSALRQLQGRLGDPGTTPVIAVVGPPGVGKSALVTAAVWSAINEFPDGCVWAAAAGLERFRFQDIVHSLTSVLGFDHSWHIRAQWSTGIRELLYRRRRVLVLDELESVSEADRQLLLQTFRNLETADTPSRVVLIADRLTPEMEELAQETVLHLGGLSRYDTEVFWQVLQAPATDAGTVHDLTGGGPLAIRLLAGLLKARPACLEQVIRAVETSSEPSLDVLIRLAADRVAQESTDAMQVLERLNMASGGASYLAIRDLFWPGDSDMVLHVAEAPQWTVGSKTQLGPGLQRVLELLQDRALLEDVPTQARVVIHPAVRRRLEADRHAQSRDWRNAHARYYVRFVSWFERPDQLYWSALEPEWGNIRQAADWCVHIMREVCGDDLETLAASLAATPDLTRFKLNVSPSQLELVSRYARSLVLHARWRHMPRGLSWTAAGAVASAAQSRHEAFGHLLVQMGRLLYHREEHEQALAWLERARVVLERRELVTQLAIVHTDISTVYREQNQLTAALEHCDKAYEYLSQGSTLTELVRAYRSLGSLHLALEKYPQALARLEQALLLARRNDNRHQIANIYNSMGLALEALDRTELARHVYLNALELYRYLRQVDGEATTLTNLGTLAFQVEDLPAAADWFRQALERHQDQESWLDAATVHHNLGQVYQGMEEWEAAALEFEAALQTYTAFQFPDFAREESRFLDQCRQRLAGAASRRPDRTSDKR